ncbi:phosphatase 2C family protein [Salix suchowensis]|nr:phosphatase 2C family protein [Salix suchowensis]
MQGWRATMEDAHAAITDLDATTSFFGVYDGHGGKVVAKFCSKFLHQQILKNEAYAAGDIGTSVQKAFFRLLDLITKMMRGQRGWRELEALGDKINKFTVQIGPHSDFSGPTCGCTACVVIIRNNQLIAYSLSRDHKPDLEAEKERILKAGGFIHAGRVDGCLNLARAIDNFPFFFYNAGDVEFKQNKFFPVEKQIVTANPGINTVCLSFFMIIVLFFSPTSNLILYLHPVKLCDDDDFLVLACDGISV